MHRHRRWDCGHSPLTDLYGVRKAYQETLREKWSLGECLEIAIDTIPGIPTYVELECKNEAAIKKVAKLLELDYSKAEYGPYDKQFVDYYGVDKNNINNVISSLTFSNIDKELQPHIKKNKDMLLKVKNDQLKLIKRFLPEYERQSLSSSSKKPTKKLFTSL